MPESQETATLKKTAATRVISTVMIVIGLSGIGYLMYRLVVK